MSSYLTTSAAASTYQTLAGMSSYLTTATAATTYAPIAAGLPTGGTVGQVLTKQSGANFDASFATLIPGDRYLTTSSTSNAVSNGNKTFTIGTGLSYTPTQNITISYDASHHMHGEVLTYDSGTGVLTVDVNNHTGTGTYSSWVVNVGGVTPATSVAWGDITGTLGSQSDLATALNNKLEVSTAASTYYLQTNPSGFIGDAPSDGSQYARKNGAWDVVSGGGSYITSVTSPLSVTSGNLSVDLSAYLPSAGGTMTGQITGVGAGGIDTQMNNTWFRVGLSYPTTDFGKLEYNLLTIENASGNTRVTPTGVILPASGTITFGDATTQNTAGYPATNPSGFITGSPIDGILYAQLNNTWTPFSPGIGDAPADGTTYGRNNNNWTSITPGLAAPMSYNAVWAYGNWYSANITTVTDGYGNYYNGLTF
jgi:hypothetical protein